MLNVTGLFKQTLTYCTLPIRSQAIRQLKVCETSCSYMTLSENLAGLVYSGNSITFPIFLALESQRWEARKYRLQKHNCNEHTRTYETKLNRRAVTAEQAALWRRQLSQRTAMEKAPEAGGRAQRKIQHMFKKANFLPIIVRMIWGNLLYIKSAAKYWTQNKNCVFLI